MKEKAFYNWIFIIIKVKQDFVSLTGSNKMQKKNNREKKILPLRSNQWTNWLWSFYQDSDFVLANLIPEGQIRKWGRSPGHISKIDLTIDVISIRHSFPLPDKLNPICAMKLRKPSCCWWQLSNQSTEREREWLQNGHQNGVGDVKHQPHTCGSWQGNKKNSDSNL